MRAKYVCNKCNHGDCELTVDDNDFCKPDTPEVCPWDSKQTTNWKLGA